MKQIEELGMGAGMDKKEEEGEDEEEDRFEMPEEPYPNYPRNKKCKCGSKESYKTCCFKEYQKKLAKMGY